MVQKLNVGAAGQQAIAQNAAEAKAAVRGMQIGIRDILTSSLAGGDAEGRQLFQRSPDGGIEIFGEMAKLSRSPENRKRIDRLTVLIGDFGKGALQIEAIRKQELALDGKKEGEAAAQLTKLLVEVDGIRKGTLAPINEEISELDQYRSPTSPSEGRCGDPCRGRSGGCVGRADLARSSACWSRWS